MATNFMSMAALSSNLVDETSGVHLQMESHADMPPQSAKNLWEMETLGSSPSHLPSWSLVSLCRVQGLHPPTLCN